jgi:hypothetical protein
VERQSFIIDGDNKLMVCYERRKPLIDWLNERANEMSGSDLPYNPCFTCHGQNNRLYFAYPDSNTGIYLAVCKIVLEIAKILDDMSISYKIEDSEGKPYIEIRDYRFRS